MFKRHTDWVKAKGVVVAVDRREIGPRGDSNLEGRIALGWVVEVQPADGESFRAKVVAPMRTFGLVSFEKTDFKHPHEGEVVSVEYDPSSKQVRFDASDPALSLKATRIAKTDASHAEFEEALNTTPPSAEDRPGDQ